MKNCTVLQSMISMVQVFELMLMQKNYIKVVRLNSETHITNQANTKTIYVFGLPLLCATESMRYVNTCEIKLNMVWKISDKQTIHVADVRACGEWFKGGGFVLMVLLLLIVIMRGGRNVCKSTYCCVNMYCNSFCKDNQNNKNNNTVAM